MNANNHTDKAALDSRVKELLNSHIDGEISVTDQQELDKLLQGSNAIRKSLEELKAVSQAISQAPELDPPEYLQHSIERQIRLPAKAADKPGFLASLLPSAWLRNGLAVSLCVIVVVGVFHLGSGPIPSHDAGKMIGTVIKSPNQNQPVLLETISLNDERLSGLVEMKGAENQLSLIVQLQSQSLSELVINFSENGLEFESIEPQDDQQDLISITKSSVSISGEGRQNYILNFKRKAQTESTSPVSIKIFADNSLVHQTKIDVSQY